MWVKLEQRIITRGLWWKEVHIWNVDRIFASSTSKDSLFVCEQCRSLEVAEKKMEQFGLEDIHFNRCWQRFKSR